MEVSKPKQLLIMCDSSSTKGLKLTVIIFLFSVSRVVQVQVRSTPIIIVLKLV